ncbi:hypothetical protein MMMDOFMJ_4029 [Methylobacterium gnaphalii]|uniref:hypothetical protein n=1 Tax=Methylobacterium gnaphalii TaxID=1010610 RepID=UPI001EE33330|nr:hypothetical protein [Methylobacterium gnaphalii]GJD71075.1 hypothetical protein MMMDOFMJ_4029 [Methylobacterium gnaphalii]
MTGGNGKPSLDWISRPDWARGETESLNTNATAANDGDLSFSTEARMAHELVSLFLTITDEGSARACLHQ